jgi:multiple sugar transport system permease protein
MTATALPGRRPARRTSESSGSATKAFNRLAATCLTLFALIWLVPFAWALITSLRPDSEITANPVSWWSDHWTLHAYTSTWSTNPIGWWYLNSFIISTLSVISTVVVCSMIGFALAHLRFRGKSVMFAGSWPGSCCPPRRWSCRSSWSSAPSACWARTGR